VQENVIDLYMAGEKVELKTRIAIAVLGYVTVSLLAGAGALSRADDAAMPKLIEVDGRHALLAKPDTEDMRRQLL
jgi:hypothetical protein